MVTLNYSEGRSLRCELCGLKYAKYNCVKCGKEVCVNCYWLQLGLCNKCTGRK